MAKKNPSVPAGHLPLPVEALGHCMLGEAREKRSFMMRQLRGLRGRSAECLRSALKPLLKGEVARSAGGVEAKPSLPPYDAERTSG